MNPTRRVVSHQIIDSTYRRHLRGDGWIGSRCEKSKTYSAAALFGPRQYKINPVLAEFSCHLARPRYVHSPSFGLASVWLKCQRKVTQTEARWLRLIRHFTNTGGRMFIACDLRKGDWL
jgi:hypothetical protein